MVGLCLPREGEPVGHSSKESEAANNFGIKCKGEMTDYETFYRTGRIRETTLETWFDQNQSINPTAIWK